MSKPLYVLRVAQSGNFFEDFCRSLRLDRSHWPGRGRAGKSTPHNRNFWHFLALLRGVFSAISPCSADPGAGFPGDGPADVSISQLFIFKCASTTPTTVGKPLSSPRIGRVWPPPERGTSVALLRGSAIARAHVLVERAGALPGWPRMDLRALHRPRRRHGSFITQCGGLPHRHRYALFLPVVSIV